MKKMNFVVMSAVFIGMMVPHFVLADWYDRYRQGGYGGSRGGYSHGGHGYYYPKPYHRGYYHRGYASPQYYCHYCYRYHPVGWRHSFRRY